VWARKPADPILIVAVRELVFMNQHKNCTDDMIVRLMPESSSYHVLDALAEARELGFIYSTNGRWAVRAKYLSRGH
jgi:hypothetical protein